MTSPHPGGHETRDVAPNLVLRAGAGVAALIVFTLLAMWWLLGGFERRLAAERPAPNPLVAAAGPQTPPAPRLQTDPLAELRALRARERARLEGWAWVDREHGRARIPIERAMELLAEGRP